MRIFPVLLILLVIFCAGTVSAEEDTDTQPDSQILLDTVNTLPPPPVDEYKDVPPGLLMSEDSLSPQKIQESRQSDQDVMTMDEIIAAYDNGQYDLVVKHLAPIAASNYPEAEELLGILYYKGQGVQEDDETAVAWLTKASDAGRPLAQHYLANLTYAGKGTPQDPVTALMWLYIAVVHYPDGPDKARALQDRTSLAARLSRRDRARAYEMARDWLKKKDEAALFDQEPPP